MGEPSPTPAPPPVPTPSSDPAAVAETLESLRKSAALLARTAEHEDAYYRNLSANTSKVKKLQRKSTNTRKESVPSPPRTQTKKDSETEQQCTGTSASMVGTASPDRLQSLFELAGIDSPGGTMYK